MAEKRATAIWSGNLTEGSGVVSSESGVLVNQALTWKVRTGASEGKTSPEELIAAAHASCFSMAFTFELQNAGFTAEKLEVTSVVTFGPKPEGGGMKIHSSALTLAGTVPGISSEQFAELAAASKLGCPVSGALAGNVEITLDATLA